MPWHAVACTHGSRHELFVLACPGDSSSHGATVTDRAAVQAFLLRGGGGGSGGSSKAAAGGKLTYGVPVERWDTVDEDAAKQAAALAKCASVGP